LEAKVEASGYAPQFGVHRSVPANTKEPLLEAAAEQTSKAVIVYLPKELRGVCVLEHLGGKSWKVTNKYFKATTKGLGCRWSMNLEDNKPQRTLEWETVHHEGIDEGNGWVRFSMEAGEAQASSPPALGSPWEAKGMAQASPPPALVSPLEAKSLVQASPSPAFLWPVEEEGGAQAGPPPALTSPLEAEGMAQAGPLPALVSPFEAKGVAQAGPPLALGSPLGAKVEASGYAPQFGVHRRVAANTKEPLLEAAPARAVGIAPSAGRPVALATVPTEAAPATSPADSGNAMSQSGDASSTTEKLTTAAATTAVAEGVVSGGGDKKDEADKSVSDTYEEEFDNYEDEFDEVSDLDETIDEA
jgi:hypothetical protein